MTVRELVERTSSPSVRVLIIDDHPLLRLGLRAFLCSKPGITFVGEGDDGDCALALVRELAADVVMMDMAMPRVGGLEATRALRAALPHVKVLGLSASEESSLVRLMFAAGAAGYALKRSPCDELVQAVRVVASGGTYVDPLLVRAMIAAQPASSAPPEHALAGLSARENEVIQYTARGLTVKEVAAKLGLSPRTLETYRARAMTKLNLQTRADLIRYAVSHGMLR